MAGNLQSLWSDTAATNASVDSTVALANGTLFSSDHGAGRAILARIAAFVHSLNGTITSGGAANAQTFTSPSGHAYTALIQGMRIGFIAGFSNSSTVTLAVDGLTAKAVRKNGVTALASGDIVAGNFYEVIYDAVNGWFQLVSAQTDISGKQPLSANGTALAALTFSATTYLKATGAAAFSVVAPSVILADTGAASLSTAQSWTANQSIGATLANIFDQVGAQRPVTSAASDTSTTVGGSTAALAIVNNNTTTNNVAQLDFAALTGANANYYTGGIIAVQFAARTNAQYVQSDMFFQTSPATNNAPTTKLTIKNTGELIATQQSPTSIYALGYLGAPPTGTPNSAYTMVLADAGGTLYHDEVTARTWTIPANASVAVPLEEIIILDNTGNGGAAGTLTISITSDTLRRGDGTAGTGSRTVSAGQVAAIRKTKSTEWVITGGFT